MSKWSRLECDVRIHRSKNISLNKLAEDIFDDYHIKVATTDYGHYYSHLVVINFEEDGGYAYKLADDFVSYLREKHCDVEGEVYVSI